MNNTFSILFYPRGNDIDKNGKVPIYARITVNGKRSEFSIKRKVLIEKWNPGTGKVMGKTQDAFELNKYMISIENRLNIIQAQLSENKALITADKIKRIYLEMIVSIKCFLKSFKNIMKK